VPRLWGDIHSEAAARFVLLRALPGSAVAPKARRKRSAARWRVGGSGPHSASSELLFYRPDAGPSTCDTPSTHEPLDP
jgi:hypothetical protein